jgi:hypothetical protein
MWDNAERTSTHLTHDMPCTQCGHATHTYLPCSDECSCVPRWLSPSPVRGEADFSAAA